MAKAFGQMDVGLVNQVSKVNKNYDSEILSAGMGAFNKASKPAVDKFVANTKKYNSIMDSFTEVSQIATMNEEERTALQPIIDQTSKQAQDFARKLVDKPNSLEAQAGFNSAISVMNRISEAQTSKYKNKVDASIVHNNNDYSPGQDKTELSQAQEIIANSAKRTFNKSGYETYVTSDGTTFDNDPNTEFSPPPTVQGTFKLGHATALATYNENVTKKNTSAKLTDAVTNWDPEGAATDLYNTFLTSGADGAPPTHGEKIDLFFNDISGDGTDVKYSDMFINGQLDQSFYKDGNGNPITLNGKPISEYDDGNNNPTTRINELREEIKSYNFASDPRNEGVPKYIRDPERPGDMSKYRNPDYVEEIPDEMRNELSNLESKFKSPAFMQNAPGDVGVSDALTKTEALEKYLRSPNRSDDNLRKFSKFYSNSTKTALDSKREKVGNDEGVMLKLNGEATYFDSKAEAQVKKKELYMSMKTDNSINSFKNLSVKKDGKNFVVDGDMDRSVEKMFRNVPGMQVKQGVSKKNGARVITVNTSVSNKSGKGTGKTLVFDVNNANDMVEFKMLMQNNAPSITDMPDLNGYPKTWFTQKETINVNSENTDGSGVAVDEEETTGNTTNTSNGNGFGGFSSGRGF